MATLTDKPTQRQLVVNAVLEQIQNGTLQPGDKLLPTDRLAAHYHVSVPTAHKAVRELVDQGYVTRKTGSGTFVTDRRMPARDLQTVGLCIASTGHLWEDFAQALLLGLRELAASPVLLHTDGLEAEQIAALPAFQHLMAAQPRLVVTSSKELLRLMTERFPKVQLIGLQTDHQNPPYQIIPDYYAVGRLCGEHLLAQGHRRVDFMDVNVKPAHTDWQTGEGRLISHGLQDALTAGGGAFGRLVPFRGAIGSDATAAQMRAYLAAPDRAPALVCRYAHRAKELHRVAQGMGLRLPQDLALVTTLDTPWSQELQISAVDQQFGIMAQVCSEMIHRALTATAPPPTPIVRLIEPRFVARASSVG